jgi:hypothetical protein
MMINNFATLKCTCCGMHGPPPRHQELTGMRINPSPEKLETVSMLLSHNAAHCFHINGIKITWKEKESKAKYCGCQWNIGNLFRTKWELCMEDYFFKGYILF